MKLKFNMGMRFIFGYGKEVNIDGPVAIWNVVGTMNRYLIELGRLNITKKGRRNNKYNMKQYIKFNTLKQL